MERTNSELGKRILELLQSNGMTQKDLSDKTDITEVSLSRYINGTRTPKAPALANIAKALHTTANDLLGTEESSDFESDYLRIHRLIARTAGQMTARQKREIVNALFESDDQEG